MLFELENYNYCNMNNNDLGKKLLTSSHPPIVETIIFCSKTNKVMSFIISQLVRTLCDWSILGALFYCTAC